MYGVLAYQYTAALFKQLYGECLYSLNHGYWARHRCCYSSCYDALKYRGGGSVRLMTLLDLGLGFLSCCIYVLAIDLLICKYMFVVMNMTILVGATLHMSAQCTGLLWYVVAHSTINNNNDLDNTLMLNFACK